MESVVAYDVLEKMVIMKLLGRTMACQRLRWWQAAILILIIGIGFAGCNTSGTANKSGGPPGKKEGRGGGPGDMERPPVTVQTTSVQRISIQRQVDLAGSLVSPDQARVSSEVSGVVQQVLVQLGQEVKNGQVVAKLDPRELDLALQRARSQLRQTEAQLGIDGVKVKEPPPDEQISSVRLAMANRDDALAQLRRAQRLRSQNLLPQADLDTTETRVKVMEANYQAAIESMQSLKATLQDRRQAVELAQKKLSDTDIRSSIAGQISERMVQQGEYIRENTPIVTIVTMNPLKVKIAIQERYAGLVLPGLPVEFSVESFPGQKFKGQVAYVSPSVDPATRAFSVEVLVDNSERRLKPGFFAKGVIFTRRDENIMAVSEDSISSFAGVSNVYVIEQGKIRQQMVTPGVHVEKLFEIISGLKGDEVLAASNLTLLATGMPVKIAPSTSADLPADGTAVPPHGKSPVSRGQGGQP
jgi:RND family efflux transporter MFP subunit